MFSCFPTEGMPLLNFNLQVFFSGFSLILVTEIVLMLCWLSNNYLCSSITNSYGASDGYPSEHGITKDAQVCVAVDFLILYDILPAFGFHQISMSMHPFLFE